MNNYNLTKEEWFSKPHFFDILLESNTLPKEPIIAELGVWIGETTNTLLNLLISNGYHPTYYAIDIFTGSPEHVDMIKKYGGNTKNIFISNLKSQNNLQYVNIIEDTTDNAALKFPDLYFDFIYVDANHTYESVRSDIHHWYPKLNVGRYFAGDDYGPYGWPSVTSAVDSIFDTIDCNHVIFYKLKKSDIL